MTFIKDYSQDLDSIGIDIIATTVFTLFYSQNLRSDIDYFFSEAHVANIAHCLIVFWAS